MFVDTSDALGTEHAHDMRRTASAHRIARAARHAMRDFIARGQLGRVDNYRVR